MAKANSGSVRTKYYHNMAQQFNWSASVDKTKRVATISWDVTTLWSGSSSTIYHLCHNNQVVKANGKTLASWGLWHKGSGTSLNYNDSNHIYNAFTKPGSYLDKNYNGKNYHDSPVKYGDKGRPRWIRVMGSKHHSGTFEVKYDAKGDASFKVDCNFAWHEDDRIKAQATFELANIGPESKVLSFDEGQPIYVDDPTQKYPVRSMPSNISVKGGTDVVIPQGPTCDAYIFKNWSGPLGSFNPGDTLRLNDSTTLTSNWAIKKYDWTFVRGDGSYPVKSYSPGFIQHQYDKLETLPTVEMQYDQDYFTHSWRDNKGNLFTEGSDLRVNSNLSFTLVTRGEDVNVNFHSNTAIDTVVGRTMEYHNYEGFPTFSYNDGYEFAGWLDTPIDPIDPLADVDLIWDPNNVKESTQKLNEYYKAHRGETLDLYAVWRCRSTLYVYTNGEWRLVVPYVYTNGEWRQSLTYVNTNNEWKQ